MAENENMNEEFEVPEIDETLEVLLLQAIEQAQQKLEAGEELIPFTSLLVGETVFEETHVGNTDDCFQSAYDTVHGNEEAVAYSFCYDGYIEADEGTIDAIIAQGAVPGEEAGVAVALIYEALEDGYEFEEQVGYIGEAPNYFVSIDLPEEDEE